jgi:tRNA(Ile)-lysidine synthase TilS/MesJ
MTEVLTNLEHILKTNHKIGISVSGGLDSTLLAYLAQDIKRKNNLSCTIEYFCVDRPDDSVVHVKRVVKYIDSYFNQPLSTIHIVGDGKLHHTEQVKSGMREAVQKFDIDVLLTGVTKTPESCDPPEYLPNYEYGKFVGGDGIPYNGPVRVKTKNPKFINPFWDITKVETVKLIKELNLSFIPKLTHTCTGSKTVRCNKCWQCCERAWAFSKNNFIDIGAM